ncbi:MAG: hypothetical protein ACUVV0_10500, partial [Anaerolineae bacterium]
DNKRDGFFGRSGRQSFSAGGERQTGQIKIDEETTRRILEALDRPKSREFVLSLAEPLLEKLKDQFPDLILKIKETDTYGYVDIAYDIKIKDKGQEIRDFLADEELMLGIEHGVTILTFVSEENTENKEVL